MPAAMKSLDRTEDKKPSSLGSPLRHSNLQSVWQNHGYWHVLPPNPIDRRMAGDYEVAARFRVQSQFTNARAAVTEIKISSPKCMRVTSIPVKRRASTA